jgi:hypothetical protein
MIVKNHDGMDVEVPEEPATVSMLGGCICPGTDISPGCSYHQWAARQPWNHLIPWNCPTYWDGCHCHGGPYFVLDEDK